MTRNPLWRLQASEDKKASCIALFWMCIDWAFGCLVCILFCKESADRFRGSMHVSCCMYCVGMHVYRSKWSQVCAPAYFLLIPASQQFGTFSKRVRMVGSKAFVCMNKGIKSNVCVCVRACVCVCVCVCVCCTPSYVYSSVVLYVDANYVCGFGWVASPPPPLLSLPPPSLSLSF